jgi:branched chain amino acid efflux pump
MNAELGSYGIFVAILAMMLATYPMRVGGYWLMAHVPLTPRVRRVLEALPGAVIVATVLPILAREGVPAGVGIAAALISTLIRRNDFVALIAGVAAAAGARYAGLG